MVLAAQYARRGHQASTQAACRGEPPAEDALRRLYAPGGAVHGPKEADRERLPVDRGRRPRPRVAEEAEGHEGDVHGREMQRGSGAGETTSRYQALDPEEDGVRADGCAAEGGRGAAGAVERRTGGGPARGEARLPKEASPGRESEGRAGCRPYAVDMRASFHSGGTVPVLRVWTLPGVRYRCRRH